MLKNIIARFSSIENDVDQSSDTDTTLDAHLSTDPPDGGLQAWTQVFAAHLIQFNTWGMANSYGIFEEYFVRANLESRSNLAWIGSLQIFLISFIGAFSGRALDYGYGRRTLVCGAILQLLGVFLASISTTYWQLLLTLGLLDALGNGLVFCPIVSLVSTYFKRKRALALAFLTCGASTGGIVLPLIVERCIYRNGFPWTMRIIGFVFLFNWIVALTLIKPRTTPRKAGPLVDVTAFRDMAYTWFCIGMFFNLWAGYFAYTYIGTFARDIVGVSSSTAFILQLILNGVGIIGRVIPSFAADQYLGAFNVYIPATILTAVVMYSWAAVHDAAGMYAFTVIYGILGSTVQGLFLACLASLTTDLQKMGTRTGMVLSIVSISPLTGGPLAGKLVEINNGSYLYAQIFGGTALVIGATALTISRTRKTGLKLVVKI